MFISYSIENFVGRKMKVEGLLIHRLENLDFLPSKTIKSPHKHLFYELFLLEKGQMVHNVDFTTYHLNSNNLFFINEEQVHHSEKSISDKLRGYRILFTKEFLQNSFISTTFLFELMYLYQIRYKPLIAISEKSQLYTYAYLLLTEYLQEQTAVENLKALLFLFLNAIKKEIALNAHETKEYTNDNIRYYDLFLKEIERNYNQTLSLTDYATRLNISTRQLSRIIKRISNTTLNKLIQDRRILQAKRLLKYSDLSIAQVAYEIGFKEPAYFCKVFKKLNGRSPNQFRKTLSL